MTQPAHPEINSPAPTAWLNPPAAWALLLMSLAWLGLAVLLAQTAYDLGALFTSWRWQAFILAAVIPGLGGLIGWGWGHRKSGSLPAWMRHPVWAVLFSLAGFGMYGWIMLDDYYSTFFTDTLQRLPFLGVLSMGLAFLLFLQSRERPAWQTWTFAASLSGFLMVVIGFLPDISLYPFSLGWSETSRFFYASLFRAEAVYGIPANPPVLHPSRYVLQSLPFWVLPAADVVVHRVWQVLLWIGMPLALAWVLVRRFQPRFGWLQITLTLAAFVFLYQAPVYYHLTVIPMIVLLGYDGQRFWRTVLVVVLASIWAGISRVNWFPVAGTLAALLYLLETPLHGRNWLYYLWQPVVWFITGLLAALGSQTVYAILSGDELSKFASSFTSDLFWYRLLPNPTYPEGILPSILAVSAAGLAILGIWLARRPGLMHPLRWLGLAGVLLVYFAGGLVVSVKIGGGDNLHNMDAYLFFLLVILAYALTGRVVPEAPGKPVTFPAWLTALLVIVPAVYVLYYAHPAFVYDAQEAQTALQEVQQRVAEATAAGEQVLLISEKHLLTFDQLPGTPPVLDYERTFLMEMAMSRNQPFLETWRADLRTGRFGLIIVQPLNLTMMGATRSFGEENDAWVAEIGIPLDCAYQVELRLEDFSIDFMVPRPNAAECP